MHLIINQTILPYSVVLVKEDKIIGLPLKKERDDILKIIGKILEENKVKLKDIQGIFVFADSLSFTQLRITITIANLMAKFLNIPTSFLRLEEVKNKKFSEIIKIAKKKLKRKIILPSYDREPNIMPILSKNVAIGNKIEHPPKSAK